MPSFRLMVEIEFTKPFLEAFFEDIGKNMPRGNVPMLEIFLNQEQIIYGTGRHEVLDGTNSAVLLSHQYMQNIGVIPRNDIDLLLKHAARFPATFSIPAPAKREQDGYHLSVQVSFHGASWSVKYKNLQADDALPEDIRQLLAVLRRNLISEYDSLFDYLNIPELPPVDAPIPGQFPSCPLHDKPMKVGNFPIPPKHTPLEYRQSRDARFPNSPWPTAPLLERSRISHEPSLYCLECVKEARKWHERNNFP
ncbi:MAG: hypothetical protein JJU29_09405 [Verrucomicrobia bacterium]|nr:hypothetical protein [Verrucomicrobiota bacterium]MCH8514375.1 hypothetical protein [Kiritimatiellia bacterium]